MLYLYCTVLIKRALVLAKITGHFTSAYWFCFWALTSATKQFVLRVRQMDSALAVLGPLRLLLLIEALLIKAVFYPVVATAPQEESFLSPVAYHTMN